MADHPALHRNDAYLAWVERHNICPFARPCREKGRLRRDVLRGQGADLWQRVDELLLAIAHGSSDIEVALVILPDATETAAAFDTAAHFAHARLARALGEAPGFFCVAFHPEMPGRDDDPDRLVGLLRRSPDPTLQVVRASLLAGLRGGGETRWVDTEDSAAVAALAARPEPLSASDRIAAANLATWHGNPAVGEALRKVGRTSAS